MAKMAKLVNPTWADIAHENLFDAKTVAEMIQVTVKALKKNLSEEQYIEAGRGLLKDFYRINRRDPKDRTSKVRARCLRTIWEYDSGG
jgi:hypothetical protein